jgi:hypothetical protein
MPWQKEWAKVMLQLLQRMYTVAKMNDPVNARRSQQLLTR